MTAISVRPYLTGSGDQAPNILAALNAASSAGGGQVIIDRDLSPTINSTLSVPANCSLIGEFSEVWPRKATGLIGRGSTIIIGSGATIQMNENSGLTGIILRPSGMTFPQSAAQVANWTGTAVTRMQGAHGVFIEDSTIVGFQYAVKDSSSTVFAERFYCNNLRFDCLNGIYLQTGSDILTFEHTTGWPMAADDNGPLADQYRSGVAFYLTGNGTNMRIDAPEFLQCFAFGYATGYHLSAVGDARFLGCYVDYPATKQGFVNGFIVDGGTPNVQLVGCHVYNTNRAVQFIPGGNEGLLQMTNCTAENVSDQGVYAESGAGIISACAFLGPAINISGGSNMQEGVLINNAPSGSKFSVESCYFNATTYAVLAQTTHPITYGNANITGPLGANTVST